MEDSDKGAEVQQAKGEAELRKLNLEVSDLQWQNSWRGRLSKFAPLSAVLVVFVTVSWSAYQLQSDRQKERDLRAKELRERADNRYRSDVNQLLRYPTDPAQTKASAIFVLNDLADVIQNDFQGEEQSRKQSDVGKLIQKIIEPVEFDTRKLRNIDFDRAALECEYYKKYLRGDRNANLVVLTKYKEALAELRMANRDLEQVVVFANSDWGQGTIPIKRYEKLKPTLPLFLELVYAYGRRVDLLNESVADNSQGADAKKADLDTAFCYLHGNTNNPSISRHVFGIPDNEVRDRYKNCAFH